MDKFSPPPYQSAGSVQTVYARPVPSSMRSALTLDLQQITLAPQNVITKTITLGAPPQPSPTEVRPVPRSSSSATCWNGLSPLFQRVYTTVYITEAGQVKPTAVLCPGGAQGAVETLLITDRKSVV